MENERIQLGIREGWGVDAPFSISVEDRNRHAFIIGGSGTGKSTLLENMATQDILAGRGLAFIDPHGDSAAKLLNCIPKRRVNDTIYFAPADIDYPPAFNLVADCPWRHKDALISGIVSAFKGIWVDSWGPRLEYVLTNCVAALMECPGSSLLGVQRMLSDDRYRYWVVKQVENPVVRSYWLNEFARYDKRLVQEIISPIQNKIGRFFMSASIRNILGQVKNRINLRRTMDKGNIFIADLSKGKLGADTSQLLGALCMAQFQVAAMSRADVGPEKRRAFTIYADEYSSYTSQSLISILSEIRKYGVSLVLATQMLFANEEMNRAVLANSGTLISFRVGPEDADRLAKAFGGTISPGALACLSNRKVIARVQNGGEYQEPFSGKIDPPNNQRYCRGRKIIRQSRSRYATRRKLVERKIESWLKQPCL